MPIIRVEQLTFDFDPGVTAEKYDNLSHYRSVFIRQGNPKAMDIVAVESGSNTATTWLIEAKDFRVISGTPKPANYSGLAQTVWDKAKDTITGLTDAAVKAVDPKEKRLAMDAVSANGYRIVLHLEPHQGPHRASFPDPTASVLQQLRGLAKTVDPNSLVLNIANTPGSGVPWSVS